MASNSQSFGTNQVVLDDVNNPDGVLSVSVRGEANPRLTLSLAGVLSAGNGSARPVPVSTGGFAGDTDWVSPSIDAGSWLENVNVRHRSASGFTTAQGRVTNQSGGNLTNASVLFTLPAGQRPVAALNFASTGGTNGFQVKTNGDVCPVSTLADGASISCNFTFYAEAV